MKGALAIASREIRELRLALLGSAIVGLIPLVPRFWPGGPHPVDVGAAILATVIGCALLAAIAGTTIIGGDLADRMLGFYFARPVSGFDIWAGKVAGGAAVVAAGSLLATLPGALATGGSKGLASEIFTRSVWPGPGDVVLGIAALYCLAVGAGIVFRSRSGLAGIDLAAGATAALVSARIVRVFVLADLVGLPAAVESAFALFAGAILAASGAGIIGGRFDRRRVHVIFSTVLWSTMAAVIAAAGGLALWICSASPSSIETIFRLTAAPRNGWIEVAGRTRNRFGYTADFLLNTDSGRFVRLGGGFLDAESLTFSADSRRAAWWEPESGGQFSGAHLATLDLTSSEGVPRQTKIARPDRWARLVLDGDGSHVAFLGSGQVSIYEISSERLLASVRIPNPKADVVRAFFEGPSIFRFVLRPGYSTAPERAVEVMDLDVSARRLDRRASWPVSSAWPAVLVSPSHDRLLVTGRDERSVRLLDINSGTELARIPSHPKLALYSAKFIDDGRIVVIDGAGGSASLRLFARNGEELQPIPLGKAKVFVLGGESIAGTLITAFGESSSEMQAVSIDVDRARTRVLGDNLRPAAAFAPAMRLDPTTLPQPGSPATRLFFTPSGGLVSIDPTTGAQKALLTGRSR